MGFEAKEASKQFHTCNNCHNKIVKQHINAKKSRLKVKENEEN